MEVLNRLVVFDEFIDLGHAAEELFLDESLLDTFDGLVSVVSEVLFVGSGGGSTFFESLNSGEVNLVAKADLDFLSSGAA